VKTMYVDFIERIIADKDSVFAISRRILESMRGFTRFFDRIAEVTRRLEVITMITRIELSRHRTLERELRGALSEVSSLPGKIKQVVAGLLVLYRGVSGDMEASVDRYSENSRREEGSLRNGVEAIKKVSVELFESRKYYENISERVADSRKSISSFVEAYEARREALSEVIGALSCLHEKGTDRVCGSADIVRAELMSQVDLAARARDILKKNAVKGEYRAMMIVSLFNEIHDATVQDSETIFF